MSELIIRECDILNVDFKFEDKITVATEVAKELANVIENQKLYQQFSGNKYVTVDGWNTLGTMLGCTPYVENVKDVTEILGTGRRNKEKVFEATVSIRRGDTVLARANSICSNMEKGKENQDPYAIYSMAQTRAIGKCYRLALGWIIKMSGYQSTPAEEMQENMVKAKTTKHKVIDAEKGTTTEPEPQIIDVTPESANIQDEPEKIVAKLCSKLQKDGNACRKASLMKLAKTHNCPEDVIDYIKTLNNDDLKAKYDT